MTTWLDAWPVLLTTLALTLFPGVVVLTAAGVRGLDRFALAAPTTLAVVGVTGVLVGLARLPFNPLTFAISTALVGTVSWVIGAWLRRHGVNTLLSGSRPPGQPSAATWVRRSGLVIAVATPALLIGSRYIAGIGSPENISQSFDNAFHLNAVALISQTQAGSSLTLGNLTDASRAFYPAAMHDLAALIVQLGGFSVPAALNSVALVAGAVIWPLSVLFLTVRIFDRNSTTVVLAGVISTGFSAFPYLLMTYGWVAPLHVANAMIPVAIGLLIDVFRRGDLLRNRTPAGAALLTVVIALGLTHPSALVATSLFASPFVIAQLVSAKRHGRWSDVRARTLVTGAYVALTAAIFIIARPSLADAPWTAFETTPAAVGDVVTSAPMTPSPAWGISLLIAIGFITAVRNPARWWPLIALSAIGASIYVVGASFAQGAIRDILTGPWYRDNFRLAALLPIAMIPLAVLGGRSVIAALSTALGQAAKLPSHVMRTGTAQVGASILVALLLVPLTQSRQLDEVQDKMHAVFTAASDAPLLSPNERELLQQLAQWVPSNGTVVGEPLNGAGLSPAFSHRRALAPHVFGQRSDDEEYLLEHWDDAASDPGVCDRVERLNAYWALVFPGPSVSGRPAELPGLRDVASAKGVEKVTSVGEAALYELTACGPVPSPTG